MSALRALFGSGLLLALILASPCFAQTSPDPGPVVTLTINSRLVFLDITVLDKAGRPVTKGLTQQDFSITEEKQPQRIFSFEPPQAHVLGPHATGDEPSNKAPVTILVLDLLNSDFGDGAYLRYSLERYLRPQPSQLSSPTELMVLSTSSLDLVESFTRSRDDLIFALRHVPAEIPYKLVNPSFLAERFADSNGALQQIALQSRGVPGRKNIVWVGHGGPGLYLDGLGRSVVDKLNQFAHETTNMLVDARMSLFVVYPGLTVIQEQPVGLSERTALGVVGDTDPFSGDITFGTFVNETGGKLFFNRNDVDAEIKSSQELGSNYYTLTYQPPAGNADGRFRRIRVTMRNPDFRIVTKAGYFAPDRNTAADPRQQTIYSLAEAAHSSLPLDGLDLTVEKLVRHPDNATADFTVVIHPKNMLWQPSDDATSVARVTVAAVSLSGRRDLLASKLQTISARAPSQEPRRLALTNTRVPLTLHLPRKTNAIRVVVAAGDGGRIGSVELTRQALQAAPEAPTPPPPPPPSSPPTPPPANSTPLTPSTPPGPAPPARPPTP